MRRTILRSAACLSAWGVLAALVACQPDNASRESSHAESQKLGAPRPAPMQSGAAAPQAAAAEKFNVLFPRAEVLPVASATLQRAHAHAATQLRIGAQVVEVLRKQQENAVVSPYLLGRHLWSLWLAGDEQWKQSLQNALGPGQAPLFDNAYPLTGSLRGAMSQLARDATPSLASTPGHGKPSAAPSLRLGSALWVNEGLHPAPDFLRSYCQEVGGVVSVFSAGDSPHMLQRRVNEHVLNMTRGLVPDAVPVGSFSSLPDFVLVDTIYLRGAWLTPFEKEATRLGSFLNQSGARTQVPMLHGKQYGHLTRTALGVLAEVSIQDLGVLAFFLPDKGKFPMSAEQLENTFTQMQQLKDLAQQEGSGDIEMSIPVVDLRARVSVSKLLQELGVELSAGANLPALPGLGQSRDGAGFRVDQESVVRWDEAGIEAVAAIVAQGFGTGGVRMPRILKLDRPFYFALMERYTHAPLLLGSVSQLQGAAL